MSTARERKLRLGLVQAVLSPSKMMPTLALTPRSLFLPCVVTFYLRMVNANIKNILTSPRSTFDLTKIDQQPEKQHLVAAIYFWLLWNYWLSIVLELTKSKCLIWYFSSARFALINIIKKKQFLLSKLKLYSYYYIDRDKICKSLGYLLWSRRVMGS